MVKSGRGRKGILYHFLEDPQGPQGNCSLTLVQSVLEKVPGDQPIRRPGPAFSWQQHQYYVTSWILPLSLGSFLSPLLLSHPPLRHQPILPALPSIPSRIHRSPPPQLPPLMWTPAVAAYQVFFIPLCFSSLLSTQWPQWLLSNINQKWCHPQYNSLIPYLSEQKPFQNVTQNPQGGTQSPGLLSALTSCHWRSFSLGQFCRSTAPSCHGHLALAACSAGYSDPDSHRAFPLTAHVCLLKRHLLGEDFPDHLANSTSGYFLSPQNTFYWSPLHSSPPDFILNLLMYCLPPSRECMFHQCKKFMLCIFISHMPRAVHGTRLMVIPLNEWVTFSILFSSLANRR